MDQPKIERMLRLMRLMASNTNYTIDELAEKLKMSYRTIYRYIDTFKASGFAVAKLYSNVYKLGKMPKRAPDFENLIYFSEEEAYIVNSLIDNLDQTNNLKANLKRKLATIYNSTNVAEYIDKKGNSANIKALSEAIKNKQKVRLVGYESAHSDTVKDRVVEPFAFTTNLIDVWAYDLEDLHNKVFKISRIGEVETLDEDWEFEGSHRRQSTDVFRMSGKSAKKIKLRLGIRAKNLLLEEYPLAAKDITRKGAYWILETGVYDYAGVCRFYCGLADDIEIIDSPKLEEYVQDYAREHIIR